jgi:hypothetical protein
MRDVAECVCGVRGRRADEGMRRTESKPDAETPIDGFSRVERSLSGVPDVFVRSSDRLGRTERSDSPFHDDEAP